jgi:2-hydroxyacylsphingosine 1-beta-galactosyltransferase
VGTSFLPVHYYRLPRLASLSKLITFAYGDRMTFAQRLINCVTELVASLTDPFGDKIIPFDASTMAVTGPLSNISSVTVMEAVRRSSLWLMVEDIAVGYAWPLMPNTVPICDIMTGRPVRPLSEDLEKFVSASIDGVIVVSFGSYLDNVPDYVVDKFCDAFRRLRAGVHVVWKLRKSTSCSDAAHVKTLPWIPQNDLLADDRVRLFISHGGLNGLMETIYHAKPVVIFPLISDQPANAAAVVSKGFAIRMDIGDFTADSLLGNMEEILSNRRYEENVRVWSSIVRDRSETTAERVSNVIEHVIKYGDKHLRTGGYELSLLEYLMFDVFVAIYFVIVANFLAIYFVLRCICRKRQQNVQLTLHSKTKTH